MAHVARRYHNRGVAYSDLFQEGFCGLLEAIDRFDLAYQTKLSTYATWWIRQTVQSAVAGGAYPVRLTPRDLRQLADNQNDHDRKVAQQYGRPHVATESIQRIRAATRPAISLGETRLNSLHKKSETERDLDDIDLHEAVAKCMGSLRPVSGRFFPTASDWEAAPGFHSARSARSWTFPRSVSDRSRTLP